MNLDELKYYLSSIQSLLSTVNLNKPLHKEGTTLGQVAFHAAQAANYWLRVVILKERYHRNREEEFSAKPTLKMINDALNSALEACEKIVSSQINLNKKVEGREMNAGSFKINTVFTALVHVIAHTAEHYGEIKGNV